MDRAALLLCLALPGAGACTTFAFSAPSGDASTLDSPTDAGAEAAPSTTFLALGQAGALCSLLFKCPGLAESIEGALAIPVNTPSSQLDFSGCLDWLAGPVDPARPGLATQQGILQRIASATTCADAYGEAPIRPTGQSCTASSCTDGGGILECSVGLGFTAACAPPIFGAPGQCTLIGATPTCVSDATRMPCTSGLSCQNTDLVDCFALGKGYTSYDCSITGRVCDGAGVAACVGYVNLAPPCPIDKSPESLCFGSGATSSVEQCVSNAVQSEIGCGPIGRSCSEASGVARCIGPSDACGALDPAEDQCSATGTGVTVCIGGKRSTFDCGQLGGGMKCVPASAGQSAHCG